MDEVVAVEGDETMETATCLGEEDKGVWREKGKDVEDGFFGEGIKEKRCAFVDG